MKKEYTLATNQRYYIKKIALDFDLKGKKVYCGHNGSGRDRIAWDDYVAEFISSETDREYFNLQEARYKKHSKIN